MTAHKVLLLNSDKDRATSALRGRADVEVAVICRPDYAAKYDGLETALVSSLEAIDEVTSAAVRLSAARPFSHVIGATEKSVAAAGWLRSLFGLPGLGADGSLRAAHKRAMKDELRRSGVPVASATETVGVHATRAAVAAVGSCVVKPVFGALSKDTFMFRDLTAFDDALEAGQLDSLMSSPVLVEERITVLNEYHCEAVLYRGQTEHIAVSRYLQPVIEMPNAFNGGYFLPPSRLVAKAVRNLHERTRAALGLKEGVTHLEVLDDGNSLRVGEIAVRPGGLGIDRSWYHAFGVDLWDCFVGTQLDEPSALRAVHKRDYSSFVGLTQLPSNAHTLDKVRAHPAAVEVLSADQSGSGNVEVHFMAPDERAFLDVAVELYEIGGHPNPSVLIDHFNSHPQA